MQTRQYTAARVPRTNRLEGIYALVQRLHGPLRRDLCDVDELEGGRLRGGPDVRLGLRQASMRFTIVDA